MGFMSISHIYSLLGSVVEIDSRRKEKKEREKKKKEKEKKRRKGERRKGSREERQKRRKKGFKYCRALDIGF